MEEKQTGGTSVSGTCHSSGTCAGMHEHMHQFCMRHCCIVKCIAIVIVLAVVYTVGYCAGAHTEYRYRMHGGYLNYEQQYGGYDQYGGEYRGMMGGDGYQNSRRNMMYRVSDTPTVTVTTSAPTPTTPAVPVVAPK